MYKVTVNVSISLLNICKASDSPKRKWFKHEKDKSYSIIEDHAEVMKKWKSKAYGQKNKNLIDTKLRGLKFV